MRVALLSPYSWTYPGGVTRHIEALAGELEAAGHEPVVLAPFDPDDALSARLHRGAHPERRAQPANLISLGRTVGVPANGAVSNLALGAQAILRLRQELRSGRYDVAHIHEPVVPHVGWDALLCCAHLPLVGTFHTYSENLVTNRVAAVALGGRRRMNRLHVRIAVSEAAAWTARRFYGGRYRIIPNGVRVAEGQEGLAPWCGAENLGLEAGAGGAREGEREPLRVVFVGQAVARKGLPVLLRAFEALREHVPATLTLVGARAEEVAHMMLDDRGVRALGKVSEAEKHAALEQADVLCAPSLHGESFGMVLTEAFAAGTPVLASDIPGYRDVVRDGQDGRLLPAGDPLALAEALREFAHDPARRMRMAASARERARRYAWPHVAGEVIECYEQARVLARQGERADGRMRGLALRRGLSPADLKPRVPAERLASLQERSPTARSPARRARAARVVRRASLFASTLAAGVLAALALQRVGVTRVAASLVASKPGLLAAGLGLMCAAMLARAISWHAILAAAPTWRRARRRDAMQGTFIGVLMSATLPARLGEPSRALIVARRLGRASQTLPVVLGTMVSQTLINLLALTILGAVTLSRVSVLGDHDRALVMLALTPLAALLAMSAGRVLLPLGAGPRARRTHAALARLRRGVARVRDGLRLFAHPRAAAAAISSQLVAWALQWLSCWLLLRALGIGTSSDAGAAAAVLFAVNVTAVLPATPANVGIFQAACVAVLAGAYHVGTAEAIAYGIVLQLVEIVTALLMGLPALANEGMSWRDVRLRTMHAAPVRLPALAERAGSAVTGRR